MYKPVFGNMADNKDYQKLLKRTEWLNPFDKIFDDMLATTNPELYKAFGDSVFEKNAYPKVNIVNYNDFVTIEAAVPGMKESEVNVEVDGNTLTISGSTARNQSGENDDSSYLKREIKRSSFARSFTLSKELDTSKIEAKLDLGLLTVKIKKVNPKQETSQKKKILINQ